MINTQVIFKVGRGSYSFDSMKVRAVEANVDIKVFPGAPECISGLAELRGEAIAVLDLHKKFATGLTAPDNSQVVFVNIGDTCLGCIVDAVVEIGAVTEDIELDLPYLIRNDKTGYVAEIVRYNGNLITVVDAAKLLDEEENEIVSALLGRINAERKAKQEAEAAAEAARKAEEAAKKAAEEE